MLLLTAAFLVNIGSLMGTPAPAAVAPPTVTYIVTHSGANLVTQGGAKLTTQNPLP